MSGAVQDFLQSLAGLFDFAGAIENFGQKKLVGAVLGGEFYRRAQMAQRFGHIPHGREQGACSRKIIGLAIPRVGTESPPSKAIPNRPTVTNEAGDVMTTLDGLKLSVT